MSAVLAIDLGGTRLRAGLADSSNPAAVASLGEWTAPGTLAAFTEMVGGLLFEHQAGRLGLGIPGLARGTVASWVPNLGYLDGNDLGLLFPGIEIALGNDAQFALLAEVAAGSAKGMDDAILLAIGTGIGSAVLAGGRIVRGSNGGACSFGWAAADVNDPGEDRSGWLERHASGRVLDAAAQTIGLGDGAGLIAAARSGSEPALAALETPMRALGTTLAGAVALLDPETVILAGGVAGGADVLVPPLLVALRRQLPRHLRGITVKPGTFGSRAGLVGAAFAGSRGRDWGNGDGSNA
ncbi:MAG: putative N-acetyl-glucosamine kinase 2, family [Hyphomicrobiales bacterium]|nr:putative N-acetyl-glucosamine kinase 2, family [Hyphomicrobiales bacterium]